MDEALERDSKREEHFWRRIIQRLLDVILMLASCKLPFRGSCEKLTDRGKSNVLFIVELLSKYDPALQELLQLPSRSVNYSSPQTQNELI